MPRELLSKKRQWVMLQSPGCNVATFGVLLMLMVHLGILWVWNFGDQEMVNRVYEEGGLSWAGLSGGRIWQLLTHAWLHGSLLHLISNALLFYYAAARLSHVLGDRRIAALFVLTSVVSGLAHVLAQVIFPAMQADVLVGASGGIMGMLLGFFALSPDSRMLFLPVSARNLAKGFLISSAVFALIHPALELPLLSGVGSWVGSLLGDEVFRWAHLAHFAGGVLGWTCIGYFFPRLLTSVDLAKMRMVNEAPSEVHCGMVDGRKLP